MATETHYTYITRSPDGRYYIGVRTCDGDPADDPYMGSHRDPTYVPNRKRVLATFDSREAAISHEIYLHDLRDVGRNTRYANRAKQKSTKFDTSGVPWKPTSDEIDRLRREKLRVANAGENNPMHGRSGELSPQYGLKRSAESKEKMRQAKLGKVGNRLGAEATEDTRKKISEQCKKRRWFRDPNTGMTKFCLPEEVPEGYVPGRGTSRPPTPPELKRAYFHNPETGRVLRCVPGREPPGYLPGKGKRNLAKTAYPVT